ncbi:hypothetical protein ACLX1H_008021 [Fusarium chlamydosporum]
MPGLTYQPDFTVLSKAFNSDQVLLPGTKAYESAVFIGNLNYRYTSPAVVLVAKSVQDVKAAISFAKQNGLKLTVKNGGHSYMGYCLNKGGVVLDMSGMVRCDIDVDKMTIDMEGGLIWKDVYYKHLEDKRNIVIGGQCAFVGVSGFTLGGGLSPFSRSYGLGCDNLLEMKIITAQGEEVTVSKEDKDEKKRDLFWALCGGGGGNFGVTVSMTSKMHKLKDREGRVVCGQLVWNLPQQQDAFDAAMQTFNSNKCPSELTIDALWSHGPFKQFTGGMTVIYNGKLEDAQEALKPLLAHEPFNNTLQEMPWTNWVEKAEGWDVKSEVQHHHASFIFAEGAITPELTTTIGHLVREAADIVGITDENHRNSPKCHFLWDHIGAQTEEILAKDTAFYWRNGHYVATIKVQWTNKRKNHAVWVFMKKCQEKLHHFAIDQKAAYVNYIDGMAPNWQEAYYGQNYARLQKIKSDWDPDNFFNNFQSIKPLGRNEETLPINGVTPSPSRDGIPSQPLVQKVENWWDEGAEASCYMMSKEGPLADGDVIQKGAEVREEIMKRFCSKQYPM